MTRVLWTYDVALDPSERASVMAQVIKSHIPMRFWIEASLSSMSALLFIIALALPDWLEFAFHIEPDAGNGALEWAIAILTSIVSLVCFAFSRREWIRAHKHPMREIITSVQDGTHN